jgi:hypothetical protein
MALTADRVSATVTTQRLGQALARPFNLFVFVYWLNIVTSVEGPAIDRIGIRGEERDVRLEQEDRPHAPVREE